MSFGAGESTLRDLFYRTGLLGRLVLSLAVVGLLPLFLLTIVLLDLSRSAMEQVTEQRLGLLLTAVAERVDSAIESDRSRLDRLGVQLIDEHPEWLLATGDLSAEQPGLESWLTAEAAKEKSGESSRSNSRPGIPRTGISRTGGPVTEDFVGLGLVGPDGELRRYGLAKGASSSLTRVLAATELAAIAAVGGNDKVWVRLSTPLVGSDVPTGFQLVGVLAGEALQELVLQASRNGPDEDWYLTDRNRLLIAGNQSLSSLEAQELDAVMQAQLGQLRRSGGSGVNWLRLPSLDWWLICTTQPGLSQHVQKKMLRNALLALGLSMFLIAALSWASYRNVVQPIRELLASSDQQQSDRSRSGGVPPSGVRSEPTVGLESVAMPAAGVNPMAQAAALFRGNEIDQLRESFRALEQSVLDRREIGKTLLGRYEVRELIGQGAMGTVFRGWDPELERDVALKTLRVGMDGFGQEKLARVLKKEAVTMAGLIDPHIVSVYDVVHEGEMAFIAMEFVEGLSLDQMLRLGGRLSLEETSFIGSCVARALATAHRQGVVHRDVKPGNVLMSEDGSVKVVDFGVAHLAETTRVDRAEVLGTPGYLPPEVLDGGVYDESCDLFGLGCIVYQCLVGEAPFVGKDLKQTIQKTFQHEVRAPSDLVEGVPADLDSLILQMIHKDPGERLSDARQVARALERYVPEDSTQWRLVMGTDQGSGPAIVRP